MSCRYDLGAFAAEIPKARPFGKVPNCTLSTGISPYARHTLDVFDRRIIAHKISDTASVSDRNNVTGRSVIISTWKITNTATQSRFSDRRSMAGMWSDTGLRHIIQDRQGLVVVLCTTRVIAPTACAQNSPQEGSGTTLKLLTTSLTDTVNCSSRTSFPIRHTTVRGHTSNGRFVTGCRTTAT